MRFALIVTILTLVAPLAFAAPGDTYDGETNWSEGPASKRQFRTNDRPTSPAGFSVTKRGTNLGNIVALAVVENDLFVADAAQDRVLRLKSRNANSSFETRAEFLIGFHQINDMAANSNWLFMSDNAGVWKIDVGTSLVATQAPKLLYAYDTAQKNNSISIAIHPKEETLVVGTGNCVTAVHTHTGTARTVACGKWHIQDIAISPNGGIWASAQENGTSYILPIRDKDDSFARLKLPVNSEVKDIQFWHPEKYPKNWPKTWTSDLVFSLTGSHPMLARAHFNFGDIAPEFTSFIDGFSKPSRFVGGRDYWGIPGPMAVLNNGHMVFAEHEQGALWALEKENTEKPSSPPPPKKRNLKEIDPPTIEKNKPPTLPRGSSIGSASKLETDELLKRPEILDKKNGEE